ncbi:MAG TPA: hypothetical protein VGD61_27710 [Pyrinomonadaceae bacterium]
MLEVDDSLLTESDHSFLKDWAAQLSVSEPVLLGRVIKAALDGEGNYVEGIPKIDLAPDTPRQ